MEVIVSVPGKFHAFNLAEQIAKYNSLKLLITSYPKFKAKNYKIDQKKIRSILIKEIFDRIGARVIGKLGLTTLLKPYKISNFLYDHLSTLYFNKCDIYNIMSGSGVDSFRKAKTLSKLVLLEAGSTHVKNHYGVLEKEYEKYDVPFDKELADFCKREQMKEYELADYIVIPSNYVKKTFIDNGVPASKIVQIPYGTDINYFTNIPKEDSVFRIVFSGTIGYRKGVHYLIQAFHELKLPNAELLLLGNYEQNFEPILKKYQGSYTLGGRKPYSELYKYYSQGSLFVLPSLEEGLAKVLFEAMACKLPIICTESTGGSDIISDREEGFIITAGNVEQLKEKILFLYNNPNRLKEMGDKAQNRVRNSYTWDDYGKLIITKYTELLKKQNL